jgi:hypothetical protein
MSIIIYTGAYYSILNLVTVNVKIQEDRTYPGNSSWYLVLNSTQKRCPSGLAAGLGYILLIEVYELLQRDWVEKDGERKAGFSKGLHCYLPQSLLTFSPPFLPVLDLQDSSVAT